MSTMQRDGGGSTVIGVGTMDITAVEKDFVNRVLDSGLITAGPVLDEFERKFAALHGCRHGLMLNSGTDALRVALAALKEANGWSWDDEVIVPALTFIATSNVVLQNDMTPVFVDVDPYTFNIDTEKLEWAITKHTKAIIPVHLFGLPANMSVVMQIARKHGLKVIEDSCEAMNVKHQGRVVGSFGDIACFSTYAAHIISTGVGGLAITNDDKLAALMKSYANHGRDPQFLGFRDSMILNPAIYSAPDDQVADLISNRFSFQRVGWSSRATQLEAALGLGQLQRIREIVDQRMNNFVFLHAQLYQASGFQLQHIPTGAETAAMMFPIVLADGGPDRRDVMAAVEKGGVETRPFFNILNQQPYVDRFGDVESRFPVAQKLSRRGFYVGCHQNLTPADLWQIVDVVKESVVERKVAA
jgi:perosamine synthetase